MNIKTVITIEIKSDKETFESQEFQKILNAIKTGEMRRDFEDPSNKLKN